MRLIWRNQRRHSVGMHSSDAEAPCCDSEIVFLTDATRIHAHTRDQQPRSQWRRYARRLGAVRSAWRWVAARSRGTRACSDHTHRAIGRGNVLAIVTPIPGLTGWEGLRNQWPRWHFAFHSLPDLPEALVSGNERIYLNWFFQTLTYNKAVFSESRVERYVQAYSKPSSLHAGFEYYRAFEKDAVDNQDHESAKLAMPVPSIGGANSRLNKYVVGQLRAGTSRLTGDLAPESGHWIPEEQPEWLARRLMVHRS